MTEKVKAEIAKNLRDALKSLSCAIDEMDADGKRMVNKPVEDIINDHDLIQLSKIAFLDEKISSMKDDIRKLLFYFI